MARPEDEGFSGTEGIQRDRYTFDLNEPQPPDPERPVPPEWDINASGSRNPMGSRPDGSGDPRDYRSEMGRPRPDMAEGRPERPERPERLERPERFERPERPPFGDEQPGRPDRDFRGEDPRRGYRPEFDEDDDEDDDEYEENDSTTGGNGIAALVNKVKGLDTKKRLIVLSGAAAAVLILVIVLVNLIGGLVSATPPPAEPTPQETEQPSPVVTATPQPSNSWQPDLEARLGSSGVTVDGLRVVITEVECSVEARNSKGAVVESDMGEWCIARFTAENISNSLLTVSSQKFALRDLTGENLFFGHPTHGDVGGRNTVSKLAPNESVTGFVYFSVPEGTEASSIEVTTFGDGRGTPIKFKIRDVANSVPTPDPTPTDVPDPTNTPTPAPTEAADKDCSGLLSYCG